MELDLRNEIRRAIENFYKIKIRDYKFKSQDDEDEIYCYIDELIDNVLDLTSEGIRHIDYELEDKCKYYEV